MVATIASVPYCINISTIVIKCFIITRAVIYVIPIQIKLNIVLLDY